MAGTASNISGTGRHISTLTVEQIITFEKVHASCYEKAYTASHRSQGLLRNLLVAGYHPRSRQNLGSDSTPSDLCHSLLSNHYSGIGRNRHGVVGCNHAGRRFHLLSLEVDVRSTRSRALRASGASQSDQPNPLGSYRLCNPRFAPAGHQAAPAPSRAENRPMLSLSH